MSKVRRKPAPAFPYSTRYPVPDPLDPFAPLKVLRERASSSNAALHFSPSHSSRGHPTLEREGFLQLLDVSPDVIGKGLDITYPSSSSDNHETPPPPRAWQDTTSSSSTGYHSDNPVITRLSRPLRARGHGTRESKAYFSELEAPPTPPKSRLHHHHYQDQNEKPAGEPQHNHRRRSQSASILRPVSQVQVQSQDPPAAEVLQTSVSTDVVVSPRMELPSRQSHPEPFPEADTIVIGQYHYDDRQSHGYLYTAANDASEVDSPTVDAHMDPQAQSQRSATPPMTPDDSLSLSSDSARDRSESLSPRSLLRDLPLSRAASQLIGAHARAPKPDEAREVAIQHEVGPAVPHSADFSMMRSPSPPPSPVPTAGPPSSSLTESETEPEPEPVPVPRRGRVVSAGKRNSARLLLRTASSEGTGRRNRLSNSGRRLTIRQSSTTSESSSELAGPEIRVQASSEQELGAGARETVYMDSEHGAGASSGPSLSAHSHVFTQETAATENELARDARGSRFISHKPKKSLSHVSLGLSSLPNILTPSANTSNASSVTMGTLGNVSRSDEHTQGFALLRAPPVPPPAREPAGTHHRREPERPQLTERNVKRLSTFPVLDEDKLATESKREPERRGTGGHEKPAALAAPMSVQEFIRSPTPPSVDNARLQQFQLLRRDPTPSPARAYSAPLPPLPRSPSPDQSQYLSAASIQPPRSESPASFLLASPINQTDLLAPAPLPLSPPQPSEPPTPLPLPTPRAKSPVPRPPSRPREAREAREKHDVPAIVVRTQESVVPTIIRTHEHAANRSRTPPVVRVQDQGANRSRTPPSESRHRKRDASRDDERRASYLPVAHLRPPQVHAPAEPERVATTSRRASTAVVSAPARHPTPPSEARHQSQVRATSPPAHRTHTPPEELYRRAVSPPVPSPPRVQSPPAVPEFRAQSPPPQPAVSRARTKPPPVHSTPRAARAASRVKSQSSSQDHSTGRHRTHEQPGYAPLERAPTAQSAATLSTVPPHYNGSAPATPLPQQSSPSVALTSYSQPYHSVSRRRSRSHAPLSRRRDYHNRHSQYEAEQAFEEFAMPTKEQIRHASSLVVVQQNGVRKQFGDLFTNRKTIVIFIRHFWCPADQDYMYSIAKNLDFESLKQAGIGLVIIGLGSPAMIKSYKQIFRMPFEVYTDPTLRLHSVLGMTRRSQDLGNDVEKGEYIRHGALSGLAMVVRNAIRVGMPVWEKGGDVSQLGGEFVLGPGYSCSYTHRMRTARSHVPILHVLALAGVHTIPLGPEGASRSVLPPEDEEEWLENRRRSYMRMQARREKRSEHDSEQWGQDESREDTGYGSDVGSGSVSGHWGSGASRGADVDVGFSSAEDDMPYRRERRRPVSRFRVANPDPRPRAQPRHHQYIPPTSVESESTPYGWEADVSDLPYIQDDSYRLTDVLSYPYGDS